MTPTSPPRDPLERGDTRTRTRQDAERIRKRQPNGWFWTSLGLIGAVGWPIVMVALGAALLGNHLHRRWGTGVHFTLALLILGIGVGVWMAYRAIREKGSR